MNGRCRGFLHPVWVFATVVVAACGGTDPAGPDGPDAGPTGDDAAPEPDSEPGYRATIVDELTFTRDDRSFPVQLVRVDRPDGGRTYLEWIRSDQPGPRAVVVSTDPYGGLAWSDEDVDARWGGRADGVYEDVDGPDYDGSALIAYYPSTPTTVADGEFLHLLNDLSVLHIHGRFYAGGSVADDVADMTAGMWFLAEQPASEVDATRVGSYGGSWGGFESLYASARGDRRVAPVVTVAAFPPHDFPSWTTFSEGLPEGSRGYTEAHRKRIYATTGGPPPGGDFTGLTTASLCDGLPAATLVLHDELDNLVPIAQSERLVDTCGADVVYWRRSAEPDPLDGTHGPMLVEPGYPSFLTYAMTYLHRRLVEPGHPVVELVARAALIEHLTTVRAAQQRGEDVAFAAPRLRELCDPAVYLFEVTTLEAFAGAAVVADAVNAVWGTGYTAATIDAALATGLPPP